jgi:hypothetical protein
MRDFHLPVSQWRDLAQRLDRGFLGGESGREVLSRRGLPATVLDLLLAKATFVECGIGPEGSLLEIRHVADVEPDPGAIQHGSYIGQQIG